MAPRYDDIPEPRGACGLCFRAIKWVPVIFIFAVVVWSYYAYVIQLCIFTVESIIENVFYLIGFHILLALFLWSWALTIFTPVGRIPSKFRLSAEDIQKFNHSSDDQVRFRILEAKAQTLPVANRTITGAPRYCEKCYIIKPDRAHHCSVCATCVLKMDHHCPWVNNCVSFTNYKYFVLFLGYSFLYCLFVMLTTLRYFIKFWKGEIEGGAIKVHILFLFFVSAMFATSLISLFSYHCFLVTKNRSTLEAFRAPVFGSRSDKNGYNVGKLKNFKQVFGEQVLLWFLPVPSSLGDGLVYPTRTDVERGYNSIYPVPNRAGDEMKLQVDPDVSV